MAHFIAITASQAGPAHSHLLGAALQAAAERAGHTLQLQVVSRLGTQGSFTTDDIQRATAIVVVADMDVERGNLPARKLHSAPHDAVFADAAGVLQQALAHVQASAPAAAALPVGAAAGAADGAAVRTPVGADATAAAASGTSLRVVAITSCPTGVAHTFMAAEGLEQGAAALGHRIKVETQGSVGAQNALTAQEIAEADLVIIAADTQVDRSRFAGKRLHAASTKAAIRDAAGLIRQAQASAAVWAPAGAPAAGPASPAATGTAPTKPIGSTTTAKAGSAAAGVYKHLMTGVSYMLPFVVAGGLLIAVAFALGGIYVYDDAHKDTLGWTLFQIGAKGGFALMVPALAGFIAFSIADRPGLAPGMIGGLLANTVGAGFLGGIAAGFIAGYAVAWLNRTLKLPRTLEGLKPVLILPLLGSAVVGVAMLMLIGTPVAAALASLTETLKGLQTGHAVLLGVTLGAMMAFDMGGPVNKAAYVFATTLIASGVAGPMAAAMAAGMVPPLGIALACWWFRSRFSDEEREASKAAAVLGLSFITEGAIPFVARDPLRVIPACVIGAAVAGGLSMMWGVALQAPHGGVFVLAIPNAVNHLLPYAAAIAAGTVATAVALGLLKKPLVVAAAG